jgi:hippurate hydrolase
MTIETITEAVEDILPEIIAIRHKIHQHPELAGKEFSTARIIRKTLKDCSIRLLPPFLTTDVVGILHTKESDNSNITLRADMDALPLIETSNISYASKNSGCMHACGHDGHTAMLIGAALVLNKFKNNFTGSVRFVFQPGEEVTAMGKDLVNAGALLDPEPNLVCALHGNNNLPVGTISSKPGTIMAASGMFTIYIKGKGGHGSMPHETINPLTTACRIVGMLQTIPSELMDAHQPVVVSVCRINSGTNSNIIPDTAVIEGTFRFLDKETGDKIPNLIQQITKGICASFYAGYDFEYHIPYIPTVNDPQAFDLAKNISRKYLGRKSWREVNNSSMGAEDFAYYLEKYPGVFCWIGLGKNHSSLHSSNFDFNDKALRNGIIFLVAIVNEYKKLSS